MCEDEEAKLVLGGPRGMMKKPRSDAKLFSLPEEQQEQLKDWLLSNLPYHRVLQLVRENFNVTTSLGALSHYWGSECTATLIARRQRAVTTADEIAEESLKMPGKFDVATIEALKQKAFELSISPLADPRDVKQLFGLVLKARDQDMSEKELALARDKFEFDAAKAALAKLPELRRIAGDRDLDEDQKLQAVRRRMFGQDPNATE